jgi:hypothetical protein
MLRLLNASNELLEIPELGEWLVIASVQAQNMDLSASYQLFCVLRLTSHGCI